MKVTGSGMQKSHIFRNVYYSVNFSDTVDLTK